MTHHHIFSVVNADIFSNCSLLLPIFEKHVSSARYSRSTRSPSHYDMHIMLLSMCV